MHKNIIRYLFTLILVLAGLPAATGQQVSTALAPQKILMGEHVQLTFTIDFAADQQLIMPVFNEQINENVEILDYGTSDTISSEQEGFKRIRRTLRVTSWEEGYHPIEPFTFLLISGPDTLLLESEPALLEVEEFSIEEHTDLKDIKSILSAPVTWQEILPWTLLALVLAGVVYGIVKYLKKRKARPQPQTLWEKPDIPAHVAAFNNLEKLKSLKLWQQGKIKEYHSELSDILRRYLGKRYGISAMELTTAETMNAIEGIVENKNAEMLLQENLELADLVKFARWNPQAPENEKSLENAYEFVKLTMIIEDKKKD